MSLLNSLIPVATDSEGRAVPGALLYSYDNGTYTPKATYSDSGLITPNPNPLEADGAGRFFDVYLGAGSYRMEIRDRFGTVLWVQDDYSTALDQSDLANIDQDIADAKQILATTLLGGIDSGVADAYELTPVGLQVAPTTYQNGLIIFFSPANVNTGASTVDVAGLGIKSLVDSDGNPLTAGFLQTSVLYGFIYISGQFLFFLKSGLITTDVIEDLAITTAKIADLAVTTAKIAAKNVTAAKMADGTAYNLAGYDSLGVFTSYKNPMRLIGSGTFTAAASNALVLSSLDPAQDASNSYLLRLIGIQPATDGDEMYLTLSADAGSTYASTNYDYVSRGLASDGATARNNQGAAQAQFIVATGGGGASNYDPSNAAGETISMDIILTNVNTGTSIRPFYTGSGTYWTVNSALMAVNIGGSNSTAADYDAIKLTWSSGGNFVATGQYLLFKITSSLT